VRVRVWWQHLFPIQLPQPWDQWPLRAGEWTPTTIDIEKKEFVFTSKGVRSQACVFPLS